MFMAVTTKPAIARFLRMKYARYGAIGLVGMLVVGGPTVLISMTAEDDIVVFILPCFVRIIQRHIAHTVLFSKLTYWPGAWASRFREDRL